MKSSSTVPTGAVGGGAPELGGDGHAQAHRDLGGHGIEVGDATDAIGAEHLAIGHCDSKSERKSSFGLSEILNQERAI